MHKSEQNIQNEIRLALSKSGYVVFRVNSGKVKMQDGRFFDTGVPNGFSDLMGFKEGGKIFFIEVKNEKGRVSEVQKRFLSAMKNKGAICGVARSVEEALQIVEGLQ
ncbi:VRR-NUC domain-containing protein [Listeria monocytogenes]|nr:VRR-NUC domain-containing protein [Listeria monocytogenes]EEO6725755.1 VRR-NUC domain-containing protein [Listeria monocytogenes]MDD23044.1 VRR-NUC domain-containing protein [Listeria monocytogenes]